MGRLVGRALSVRAKIEFEDFSFSFINDDKEGENATRGESVFLVHA